ncbi:hypothetical protein CBR_g46669 [Chara braunii]|uniref:Reverse transcriptase/retrotransposon-derived protein RNase H-like domain-containing protein n=1 Tax=Chara braunii TaxID=69332 RepID=A0A388M0T3_CHABU|nr:hypothetical protein CBR_g46669 [Chara braunii]|eukprot:GBG88180.1 hypothetical protein CBR_g46669 [Chara braunii]
MAVGARLGVHFNPSLCSAPIDPGLRTRQSSGWDIAKRGAASCHAGAGLNSSARLAGKESSSALVDRAGGRVNAGALGGDANRDGQAGWAAAAAAANGPVLAGTKVTTRPGGGSRQSSALDQLLRPQPVVPGQKEAAAALAPTTSGNGKGAGAKVDKVDDKKKGRNILGVHVKSGRLVKLRRVSHKFGSLRWMVSRLSTKPSVARFLVPMGGQFKSVRDATDAVERLICAPGVRSDTQVLLTLYLRCLSQPLRNQLAKEANIDVHNFPSFSKVALDLEAKIGHGQTPTTEGKKKTLPPNWKAKGRLMFVDNDGSTIELDGNLQEGVGAEAGGDTSEGGIVAAWTDECEAAFRHLKHALTHYEVLKLPDSDKPFIGTTDASQYGIGAVLAQQEGPKLRPVEYMPKKMPSQKLAKSTYEKELYGVYKALTHWRRYLLGRFFILRTDHQTLRWTRTQPVLSDALKRWIEVIEEYDFDPQYLKGEYNKVADALSRKPDFSGRWCRVQLWRPALQKKKATKKETTKQETADNAMYGTAEYLQAIGSVIAPWEKESLLVVPPGSPETLLSLSSFGGAHLGGEINAVKKKQKPKKKKRAVVAAVCTADSPSPISGASVGGMGFSDSLSGASDMSEGGAVRQAATIGAAAVVSVSVGGGGGGLKGGDGSGGGGGEGGGGGGGDNVPGSDGNSSSNAFVDDQEEEDGAPDGSAPHGPGHAYARRRGRPYVVKPLAYMGATTGPLGQTARVPPAVNLQEGVARTSTPVANAGTGGAGSGAGTGSAITSPRASAQSPRMGPTRAVGRVVKGASAPTSGPVAASTTDSAGSPVVMDWLASIVHSFSKRTNGLDWEKEKEKIVQAAGEEVLKSLMSRSGDDALAVRSEVSALRRLQREAFSDQLKTKDRIDKLEHFTGLRKVAHLGESMAGGGALASRTRMRGDIAVGAAYPLLDGSDEKVRQSQKLTFDRVGARIGVDARFTFETAFRGGKDTLITQCVSGKNGQALGSSTVDGDALVGPITVRKVVYSAELGDNLSLKFSPVGADGADICNALNPLEGYGLTKSTAEGLPILKKCRGSAASATFRLNGASITTAQFIDRGATAFNGGGNQRPSHATVAQVTLRPEEWLVVSLSAVSQFWAPASNRDEAGTLRTPQWDDHVVQDDVLDGSVTSKVSVQNADPIPSAAAPARSGLRLPKIGPVPGGPALQTIGAAAACDLGGNITMASWAQFERAEWLSEKEKQHVRWGLTLSKAPGSVAGNGNGNGNGSSTGLGWGLSVGSNGIPETASNSQLPRKLWEAPLQMEGFLRIQCAKGFTVYPGVVCTTDGRGESTPGFVVRSHWSL